MNQLVVLTPDQLTTMLSQAIAPLTAQVNELTAQVNGRRSILTVKQIADDCGKSVDTVRDWIAKGAVPPGKTKPVKLKVVDGLSGAGYMIRYEEYKRFLAQFPDIQVS
jgi:hypothetical protein